MINLKIVVIEDDEFLLNKIARVLKREIMSVYTFKNPVEALEKIPELAPDIIVSDINMPEINGIELYKILKDQNIEIPIILASAFSEPEYFIEAIKLKVKNFIVKPIDLDDLIQELKLFEKELQSTEEQLQRERMLVIQSKMAAMGEMLGNIAHQWKQPLNTISICASNLKIQKEMGYIQDKDNVLDDMTENISKSIKYMTDTINDFQNYLKPNKLETCFYLKDTINKVESLVSALCKTNSIQIIKNIKNDVHLCSFQNELIQVLINIIKNSIDELIHLDNDDRIIKIDIYSEDEAQVIIIHDSAGGIPENIIKKVFEPYFTTKKEEGTGIGLYMSKQIVSGHLNGTIEVSNEKFIVDNKEHVGAKFILKLNPFDINQEV
ncbi:response regulator [Halarcobacter sp.]|uniref:sensor histidine kinase n=1 Tax=Halarcobacter sp. TaxID=2321133 RepID=UPI0029F54CF8|nr:response regulator [Halarcobacter sp.]